MKLLAKLVLALALSCYAGHQLGMTPWDGIQAMQSVADRLS